jgi:hypothetical protein
MDAGKALSWQTGGDVWHQDYFIVTLKPHFNVMDEPDYRVTIDENKLGWSTNGKNGKKIK